MTEERRAYFYIHLCVLLWGFTAILGALISLDALPLVWGRVLLAGAGLALLGGSVLWKEIRQISPHIFKQLVLIGVLTGLHWLCFYGAIKKSNASIGVMAMATTSLFSSFIEPWILKKKIRWHEVGLGLLVIPGMYLIVENIDWAQKKGFLLGVISAFLAALFSVLNKKMLDTTNPPSPKAMSFVQFWSIVLFLPLFLQLRNLEGIGPDFIQTALSPIFYTLPEHAQFMPSPTDWLWLSILSFGCTLLPFILSLVAMRHLSAFSTNLAINLEPVYAVLLAGLLLHEHKELNPSFYVGVCIILLAVFIHPLINRFFYVKK